MAYGIDFRNDLGAERCRIAAEQLERAWTEVNDPNRGVHSRIHQLRKRSKKARALVRLFRPADEAWYRQENDWFRDLAGAYADDRDAHVAVTTLDKILARYDGIIDPGAFEGVREDLRAHATAGFPEHRAQTELESLFADARSRIDAWGEEGVNADALLGGFMKTYRRGYRRLRTLRPDGPVTDWHDWRKRSKYQALQLKLLRNVWPVAVNAWAIQVQHLSDVVGEDHDLYVLRSVLTRTEADPRVGESLTAWLEHRSRALRAKALHMARPLYAEKPQALRKRLRLMLQAHGVAD